jgi:hypothetical protein
LAARREVQRAQKETKEQAKASDLGSEKSKEASSTQNSPEKGSGLSQGGVGSRVGEKSTRSGRVVKMPNKL